MSSPADDDLLARATGLIHHPYQPPAGFASPLPAVHKGSTVYFENTAAMRSGRWIDKSAYTYGLHGTPTTYLLEERLATLEGGTHAILAPSGLAAITVVDVALLASGDQLVMPDNVYGPNRRFATDDLARWGVAHAVYDPMDPASLAAALTPATRLVWLEAPGSVTLEFPDLPALVATVREKAPKARIAIDNTWGAGLAMDVFALGVDISVHALTKYPSGGGDVLMGSVVTRDAALHRQLGWARARLGLGVGANDAETVLRSLASMPLRYAAQDAAGRRFAQWCTTQPDFVKVLHPALPGSPGHAHWARLCRAAAGLVTVEFDPARSPAQVDRFVDALKLFRIGWSWGGPVSLAVPYQAGEMRSLPTAYRGTLVRFCLGLEAVDDLIADAAQALAALRAG